MKGINAAHISYLPLNLSGLSSELSVELTREVNLMLTLDSLC